MTKFHTVRFITAKGIEGPFAYVGPWYDMEEFEGFDSAEDAAEHMKAYFDELDEYNPQDYAVIEVSLSMVRSFGPNPARFP